MYFVALCTDKPDHLQTRLDTRPAHLDFLKSHSAAIKIAGPLLAADGETPNGSMLVLECADAEAAKALLAQDPYAQAGLFASVEVKPWRWTIGVPAV
ncbi:YciI family protein [Methylovirgula sp. 4M-Z18]|uniref:YciI family protein n=1 Tax=Methylovirgula sp. 4M-Z18 TaxID=2293567 RepID=UPI000E2E9571|nr:YciI family protein [Methylovirgula sp. 4M-Z18]RFB78212.1 YciI family protein [Methylovirgula sp. 4M-Z18]